MLFLIAVWQLRPSRPLAVADPVALFVYYLYAKHLAWLSHLGCWATIGWRRAAFGRLASPWAASGRFGAVHGPRGMALWISGFDVITATDVDFDRSRACAPALAVRHRPGADRRARICHVASIALLAGTG